MIEDVVIRFVDTFWPEVASQTQKHPIQWKDVKTARRFLEGFFVQSFDHNQARIGVFCKYLVWDAARKAMNLDRVDGISLASSQQLLPDLVPRDLAAGDGVCNDLDPQRVCTRVRATWTIAHP